MIKLKITGAPLLTRAFNNLADKAQRKVLRSGLQAASKIVVDAAKENVPVDTGNLKSQIQAKITVGKKARARITTGSARHGSFIELGAPGRGIPAQPFLRPALFENRSAERNEFLKVLEEGIREEGFKDFKAKYESAGRSAKRALRRGKKVLKKTKKSYRNLRKKLRR